jgi:hypothetical protein
MFSKIGIALLLFSITITPLNCYAFYGVCAKKIIGAKANISFVELGFNNIKAKIDTGATSSSLHCSQITIEPSKKWVTFTPLSSQKSFRMPILRISNVTSSNGTTQTRAFVVLHVIIDDLPYEGEFSLSNRDHMQYPVLIGKQLLDGNFIVDVSQ